MLYHLMLSEGKPDRDAGHFHPALHERLFEADQGELKKVLAELGGIQPWFEHVSPRLRACPMPLELPYARSVAHNFYA